MSWMELYFMVKLILGFTGLTLIIIIGLFVFWASRQ